MPNKKNKNKKKHTADLFHSACHCLIFDEVYIIDHYFLVCHCQAALTRSILYKSLHF